MNRTLRRSAPLLAMTWGLAMVATVTSAAPDLSIGASEYPHADAIVLQWNQAWTLHADGSVTRHEHKWIKLLNASRTLRRYADPRIDFLDGVDQVVIHTAQAHLPNGDVLPVPDYGYNLGAARDVDGWPAYAGWKQHIVSFSGIEAGVTLELAYEVTTPASAMPCASAEIRLDDGDPVVQRQVSITAPQDREIYVLLDRVEDGKNARSETVTDKSAGTATTVWTFGPFAAAPAEAQSQSWRVRCPRMRWSTVDAPDWVTQWIAPLRSEGTPADERVAAFAGEAVGDAGDLPDKVRRLADAFTARFNEIDSPKTYRSRSVRAPGEVLFSGYGSTLEAAAVLHASFTALGITAEVRVAVDLEAWSAEAPVEAAFAGVVLTVRDGDEVVHVHPSRGVVTIPGSWPGHGMLKLDGNAVLVEPILARGEETGSTCRARLNLAVADDGSAEGSLHVRLTGAYYDPARLTTTSDQKAFFSGLVRDLAPQIELTDFDIETLSDDALAATIAVATEDGLPESGQGRRFSMGAKPISLTHFPLPMERSTRRTPIDTAGCFVEDLRIDLEFPKSWAATIVPAVAPTVHGAWGRVEQSVTTEDATLRVERHVELSKETIDTEEYGAIRAALHRLSSPACTQVLLGPKP